MAFLLAGCRWEVGRPPGPTPTPSPTPTPTPLPIASLSSESSSGAGITPSARIASAGAEYFEQATAEALEETKQLRRALSRAAAVPGDSPAFLDELKDSLSAAAAAYRRAEASVFLVDPESTAELRAQPDPLGAGLPNGRDSTMRELAESVERIDALLARPLDSSAAASLLAESRQIETKTGELEREFRGLADAWRSDNGDNFRGKFFLPSPGNALARVFQGLLAMTGDVLPRYVESPGAEPEEISGRVGAVRDIYLGSEDGVLSLNDLVAQSSPLQAVLTRASVVRAEALTGILEAAPDAGESVRPQLSASLQDLTRQLIFSAKAIGITIVDVEQP